MIWLTWRQFRTQAWVALAALAAFVIALVATAPGLSDAYSSSGLSSCTADCDDLASAFLQQVTETIGGRLYWVGIGVMMVLPAVVGAFWGAPLIARELETGTHRLVWNQSVTRGRWLLVKLVGIGLVSVATVALFSLAMTWWAGPFDTAWMNRLSPEVFATRGVVPIAYAAFAFAVGVTAGTLVRRTVPAMAITLVVVAAAQLVMPFVVRPHLLPAVHITEPFNVLKLKSFHLSRDSDDIVLLGKVEEPGAWVVSNRTVTPTGEEFTGPANPDVCGMGKPPKGCLQWIDTLGLRQEAAYHPAHRFWPLQWYEAGIFIGLAGLLAGFCTWWVRRRLG